MLNLSSKFVKQAMDPGTLLNLYQAIQPQLQSLLHPASPVRHEPKRMLRKAAPYAMAGATFGAGQLMDGVALPLAGQAIVEQGLPPVSQSGTFSGDAYNELRQTAKTIAGSALGGAAKGGAPGALIAGIGGATYDAGSKLQRTALAVPELLAAREGARESAQALARQESRIASRSLLRHLVIK